MLLITPRSVGKAVWWSLFDLPTLATVGYAPIARLVGGKAINETVRFGFKAALRKRIEEELIN